MDLDLLRIYARVATLSSFVRAAEQLGLTPARVTTGVQQLETQLGTRLLHRTTRSVRMTPDGEQFLQACQGLLADAEELASMFERTPTSLRGRLRVDMPNGIAQLAVIPRLPEFFAAHPQVALELSTTDRRVDLVHEGFDCVLRVGRLGDSELVARPLGTMALVNAASPAYLERCGVPKVLADLDRHWIVNYAQALGVSPLGWEYHDGKRWQLRPMASLVTVTNTDAYKAACIAGLGLIQSPRLGLRDALADGRLVEVMPELPGEPMPVSLVYANRRHQPKRVLAFMDWVAGVLQPWLQA
ncbi:LysR family transcriptional regulator [Variovorax sp. J22P168]|uniref:LysR family transcriptional regulator n=1 Tax=Variovorax jilinensis TaxID=3053513 RepID=UPI00257564AD|nr:LysR family transcriptional regulator [Variovorax sp. J22P168]MDM0011632.1 LysR family transcriptional regulator [Variovorax sp. J22P168]